MFHHSGCSCLTSHSCVFPSVLPLRCLWDALLYSEPALYPIALSCFLLPNRPCLHPCFPTSWHRSPLVPESSWHCGRRLGLAADGSLIPPGTACSVHAGISAAFLPQVFNCFHIQKTHIQLKMTLMTKGLIPGSPVQVQRSTLWLKRPCLSTQYSVYKNKTQKNMPLHRTYLVLHLSPIRQSYNTKDSPWT